MNYLELKAPAKINIGLYVVEKRNDGYHNIETIFYPVYDLFDVLQFNKSSNFYFDTNAKDLCPIEDNLAYRAVKELEKEFNKTFNVEIFLDKRIPHGAGLGGGSSDAAAVLLALNEMFSLNLNLEKLREFSLRLGSDCPFFIRPNPSIGKGRGEILIELRNFEINMPILLVFPNEKISTKEAYANIYPQKSNIDLNIFDKINNENLFEYLSKLRNDFEEYGFFKYKILCEIKNSFHNLGAKFSMMSGSGSTIYGIFDSIEKANKASEFFSNHGYLFFLSEGKAHLLD